MIVPRYQIPVQPLLKLERGNNEYALFQDLQKYPWVLPTFRYLDTPYLLASLKEHIIDPAEEKVKELVKKKVDY